MFGSDPNADDESQDDTDSIGNIFENNNDVQLASTQKADLKPAPSKKNDNLSRTTGGLDKDLPMYSSETERFFLASLISKPEILDELEARIKEDLFYFSDHSHIFKAIIALSEARKEFNLPQIVQWLRENDLTDVDLGPIKSTVVDHAHDTRKATQYLETLEGYSRQRLALSVLRKYVRELSGKTRTNQIDPMLDALIGELEAAKVNLKTDKADMVNLREYLGMAVDQIDKQYHSDEEIFGLPSGIDDLDEKTRGFYPGQVIVIAGRPASGKTALALGIAALAGREQEFPVAMFSLEMRGIELAKRVIANSGSIDGDRIKTGKLLDDDWPRLTQSIQENQESVLFISDSSSGATFAEIRTRARRLHAKHGGLSLIVIDYLGLVEAEGTYKGNKAQEVGEISRKIKQLAGELGVPILLLAQVNRDVESRPNKRPMMSDLRDSGAIEQDADIIIFVYRDEVYNPDTPDKGTAELILAKQRDGAVGFVRAKFQGEHGRFSNFMQNTW